MKSLLSPWKQKQVCESDESKRECSGTDTSCHVLTGKNTKQTSQSESLSARLYDKKGQRQRESRDTVLVKHSTNKTLTSTGLKPTTTCSSPDSNTSLKQQSVTYFETRCLKKQRYIIYNDTKEIAASCDTLRSVKRSKCLAFSWSISYILTVNPKLLTIRILLINLSIHWLPVSGNHYTKST